MTREEKLEVYAEIISEAIQLQEISIKKAINAYKKADSAEKFETDDDYGNDRAARSYRKQKNKFKSYIAKKGGDKAVAGAEKAAKVHLTGRRPGQILGQPDDPLKIRQEVIGREKKKGGKWYTPTRGKNKGKMPNSKELTRYIKHFRQRDHYKNSDDKYS